jgi:mono/diheme cytochrome c family protein
MRMRLKRWLAGLAVVVVVVAGTGAYMLTPVAGPARDLSLKPDAAHGQYVMALGGCVACHTDSANKGALLAGGEAIRTQFGDFYPPNITPDKTAGIGGWTLAEFSRAMSEGQGPHGPLYPSFPYTSFTLLSDQDIVDLWAALQQVPPVARPAPANAVAFPFSIRQLVAGWQHLFFTPGRFVPDPGQSAAWNRGAYLARGPGHCIECHSPRNALGAIERDRAFHGNPSGGPGGKAPDITAASLEADGYDHDSLIDALQSGFTPDSDVLGGPMGDVVDDATSKWTDADLDAIATYLLSGRH